MNYITPDDKGEKLLKTGLINQIMFNNQNGQNIHIYPNPSDGEINIRFNKGENVVTIFQIDGTLVSETHLDQAQRDFTTKLKAGNYIVRTFNIETNTINIEKVVIIKD